MRWRLGPIKELTYAFYIFISSPAEASRSGDGITSKRPCQAGTLVFFVIDGGMGYVRTTERGADIKFLMSPVRKHNSKQNPRQPGEHNGSLIIAWQRPAADIHRHHSAMFKPRMASQACGCRGLQAKRLRWSCDASVCAYSPADAAEPRGRRRFREAVCPRNGVGLLQVRFTGMALMGTETRRAQGHCHDSQAGWWRFNEAVCRYKKQLAVRKRGDEGQVVYIFFGGGVIHPAQTSRNC